MSEKSKIIIRPEIPNEYEIVNQVIYKAFAEQHGMEIGKFMMEHFVEERQKETFIPDLSLVAVFLGGNQNFTRDTVLNHPVNMGFIIKIGKNGETKDIWFVF